MKTMIIILIALQILFIIFLGAWVAMLFVKSYRNSENHPLRKAALEAIVSIGVILCFLMNQGADIIDTSEGYTDFIILTSLGGFGFWIKKILPPNLKVGMVISNVLIGALFWMSIVAAIKLVYFYPFVIFPIYGLLIIAPFALFFIVLADLMFYKKTIKPLYFIFGSFAFLSLYTILHNMWSSEAWQLLNWWTTIKTDIF